MANVVYDIFLYRGLGGDTPIEFDSDSIKVLLVTSSYAPDRATHTNLSHVTNEVVGAGYTAGGKALTGKTVTADTTNHRAKFDADDVSWAGATITARAAVLYQDGGTPGASPLIAYIDFGTDVVVTSDTFPIVWHADGVLYLRQAA
jgi:hypothetical protein